MHPLWFLVAVATGVMAEDPRTCRITGDPHVTTFNNELTRALVNFPCRYIVAAMCFKDKEEFCSRIIFIHATNGATNGRGNSFVTIIDGFLHISGMTRNFFKLDASTIKNKGDPWTRNAPDPSNPLLDFNYTDDGKGVTVSFLKDKSSFPIFWFRPWTRGGGRPELVIMSGQNVVPCPWIQFPQTLCGTLNVGTFPNYPGLINLKDKIMHALLKQTMLQSDINCLRVAEFFQNCINTEVEGAETLPVRQCGHIMKSKNVVCYKKHGHINAAEALGYCFQYVCGNDTEKALALLWFKELDCPISLPTSTAVEIPT